MNLKVSFVVLCMATFAVANPIIHPVNAGANGVAAAPRADSQDAMIALRKLSKRRKTKCSGRGQTVTVTNTKTVTAGFLGVVNPEIAPTTTSKALDTTTSVVGTDSSNTVAATDTNTSILVADTSSESEIASITSSETTGPSSAIAVTKISNSTVVTDTSTAVNTIETSTSILVADTSSESEIASVTSSETTGPSSAITITKISNSTIVTETSTALAVTDTSTSIVLTDTSSDSEITSTTSSEAIDSSSAISVVGTSTTIVDTDTTSTSISVTDTSISTAVTTTSTAAVSIDTSIATAPGTTAAASGAPSGSSTGSSSDIPAANPTSAVPVSRAGGTLNPTAVAEAQEFDKTATRPIESVNIRAPDGRCLFIDPTAGDFRENLIPVQLVKCDEEPNQKFDIVTKGKHNDGNAGKALLVSVLTNGCLSFDARRPAGDTVTMFSCGGRAAGDGQTDQAQLYPFDGTNNIVLAPASGSNETCLIAGDERVDSAPCTNDAGQVFEIVEVL
ncbi:Fc.00g005210.m01.CDS01 [Cosmosporella sp. VM-42]